MKRVLLAPLALLLLACDRPAAPARTYSPVEEGRTLIYENPSLPQPRRSNERLQVRVATTERAGSKLLVTKTFTTLQGQMDVLFAYEDGGVTLMKDPKTPVVTILPKGFPGLGSWEDRGVQFHIEGRATLPDIGLRLRDSINPIGVWVASAPMAGPGPRHRTFYLENLGEAETQEWRDGRWVSINRLVAFGFEDAPMTSRLQNQPTR